MRKFWLLPVAVLVPALLLVPVAPAAASGTEFRSSTRWVWVQQAADATTSSEQFVSATMSGTSTSNRNAGLVVRQSAPDRYALVSFSGTRYQVRLVAGTRMSLVVDKPFTGAATTTGVARTEVRGTTISTSWDSTPVSQDTVPGLRGYTGTGVGVAIWQDRASAVRITDSASGSLAPATGDPATSPKPNPTSAPTTARIQAPTQTPSQTSAPSPKPLTTTTRAWRSGASGSGAANGKFAAWRGTPLDIAGTWNDDFAAQSKLWSIAPGAEFGAWQGDLDMSIGGIYKDRGDTWQAAANGAYDDRWRASLTKLNKSWGPRPGTVYIRFAHEFNGDWYPWSVTASEVPSFVKAWKRFRALQLEVAPRHKLVFCPNVATADERNLDWRKAFPGATYIDVMSVDAYNQYPFVTTSSQFATTIVRKDAQGAPSGLEGHRRYAESVGLPFAVSEWSSNAKFGDSPVFVTEMNRWFAKNAGTGSGRLLYEIQFNVFYGDGRFQFFPGTKQSQASATYARLF